MGDYGLEEKRGVRDKEYVDFVTGETVCEPLSLD
jgi:hypothetical protein